MAYNNGFPATYQPIYYPQYTPQIQQPVMQQPTPPAQQPTNNSIIWVQGEAGAKSYLVAPNTTVQLWDSENPVIYLKSADGSGMPTMKVLDYTIREAPAQNVPIPTAQPTAEYATHADVEALARQVNAMRAEIDRLSKPVMGDEHNA